MSLDLQLSTAKARQELQSFMASLTAFEQKLAGAGKSGGALEARLKQLASFKGVEANAVASLTRLADSLTRLANSSSQINNVSRNLNSLARVRVDAVAANVEKISKALAGLRAPPNLDRFAATLQRISTASQQAAGGVRNFAAAANGVRIPPGLNAMPGAFNRIGTSSRTAAGGMGVLGSAGRTATNALAGFGVVLGAFGFARFIQGAYEAVRVMDRFKNIVTATQGANAVGAEMAYIREEAKRTKLPIEGLIDSYGKFSAAAISTGESVEGVHKIFSAMSTAARVLKLDKDQLKWAFRGLEQMYSKGNVSMEELRRQWGEQIPGGFAIAAKAMGVTQQQLIKLIETGKVSAKEFMPKLAAELEKTFGPGLTTAITSAQAAMDNFSNAIFDVTAAFGEGFFDAFKGSLDGLASAMQNPAFIEGAKQFGYVLGQVLNGAISLLKLVADNWDAVKVAVLGVVSVAVAATLTGWVMSLGAAGQAAYQLAGAMRGVAFAVGGWGLISSVLFGLRAAFMSLIAPVVSLTIALGPVGWTLIALAVAVGVAIAAYQNWASVSQMVTDANYSVRQSTWGVIDALANLTPWPETIRTVLSGLIDGAWNLFKVFYPLGQVIDLVRAAWEYFFPPAQKAAAAMDQTKDAAAATDAEMKDLVASFKSGADAATRGASATKAFAGGLDASGRSAAGAVPGLKAYAAAAREAAAAGGGKLPYTGSVNRQGEVSDDNEVYGYAGGGIAGQPTNKTYSLPASAFVNAPSFAGGGLSDGGIPAVLHPNEAVVPLAGGGTIPVQNMSGGQSSLMLLKPLNLLVDYAKQTKVEVSRLWEAITVQTLIMRNAFDRAETILHHIDNSRLVDLINAVNAMRISGGGGGVGGFTGGSFDSSGFSGKSPIDKLLALMDANLARQAEMTAFGGSSGFGGTGGSGGLTMVSGIVVAAGSKRWFELMMPIWQAERDRVAAEYAAGMISDEEVNKRIASLQKSMGGASFATGSPNASRDANGAFNATLHSDEAVIPLPDGRTVPVTFKSDTMQRLERFMDSGGSRLTGVGNNARGGGGGITIQVNMQVSTKDAASFNASKDQIMRDLKTELDRAARTIGNRSDIDDPTRRV